MSILTDALVTEFVRATNDMTPKEDVTAKESYLYGTVKSVGTLGDPTISVQLDGAPDGMTTPMNASGVEVGVDDRVWCVISKRQGQIVSNLTSPPIGPIEFTNFQSDVSSDFNVIRANYVQTNTLEANYIRASEIAATYASISTLQSDYITASQISATYASLTYLGSDYIKANQIDAKYATLNELHSDYITATQISSNYATLSELHSGYIDAATIDADYAQIDLGNIAQGTISTYMLGNGVVGTTQIADGSVTNAKIVSLTATKITAGTLNAGVVDVINLSANSITGGTLDGANINVVNLNAANITTGTLNGLRIANGTITSDQLVTTLSNTISTASTNASTALNNAASASNAASAAQGTANSASSAASAAQSTADGKNTVLYSATQPSTSGRKANDIWFDTAHDNKMYRFSGSAWVGAEFGTDALADDAVDYDKLDSGIGSDISAAQTTANSASSAASAAQTTANSASSAASAAQTTANSASSAASAAQSTADGKNTVFYSTTQPSTTGRKANDIWFDIAHDSKMYRFSGSAWVGVEFGTDALADDAVDYDKLDSGIGSDISGAVADAAQAASDASAAASSASSASSSASQAASDASAAASSASSASSSASQAASSASSASYSASEAQIYSNQASANASSAASSAASAASAANSKNRVFYQETAPRSTGSYTLKENDIWFDTTDYNNSNGVKMLYWNGGAWVLRKFGTTSLRAGCISHALVDADAITASNIVAESITAGCLNVANIFGNSAVLAKIWSEDITATNTITSGTFIGGLIKSSDYAAPTSSTTPYSSAGMAIDLANKKIESPYFALNNTGAYIDGHISAQTLDCGGLLTFDGTNLVLSNGNQANPYTMTMSGTEVLIEHLYYPCLKIYGTRNGGLPEYGIEFGGEGGSGVSSVHNDLIKTNDGRINLMIVEATGLQGDGGGYVRDFGSVNLNASGVNPRTSANISASLEVNALSGIRGSGAYQNISDERYKIETESLSRFDNAFMEMEPIEYVWTTNFKNRDDKRHFGLKAQQVARCLADCGADFNEYGVVSYYDDIYSIAYTELIPLCIHMIQKQQKEIDRLKSLEARVEQQQFLIEQLFSRLPS